MVVAVKVEVLLSDDVTVAAEVDTRALEVLEVLEALVQSPSEVQSAGPVAFKG